MGSEYGDKGNHKARSLRTAVSLFTTKCSNLVRNTIATIATNAKHKPRRGWWRPFVVTLISVQTLWWIVDQVQYYFPPSEANRYRPFPPIHTQRIVPNETSPLIPFYDYYEPYYTGPAKAFPVWPQQPSSELPSWCGPLVAKHEMGSRKPTSRGLLYIKEMKTGSTTLAGITARIARNVVRRKQQNPQSVTTNTTEQACTSRFVHLRARKLRSRDRNGSFLWSVVREPTSRLVSKFFHFAVGREGRIPSLLSLKKYIRDNEVTDYAYYFKTLSLRPKLNPYRTDLYETFMQELFDSYDFLGVQERMDESLVALQLLLGLETQDLLYLSTKTSGSYDYFPQQQKCVYIAKAQITMDMKEWFYSEDFEEYVAADILVYQAVNASLDRTIQDLGQDKVNRALKRFHWAQSIAQDQCSRQTKFPCSADGERQDPNDCLQQDVACGYKCLDKVGSHLGM